MRGYFNVSATVLAVLMNLWFAGGLFAYEEEWNDPRIRDPEGSDQLKDESGVPQIWKDSRFRLDGQLWARYEFNDRSETGASDAQGPVEQRQGFGLGRTYVNARGEVLRGPYQGFGFRITLDAIAPAAEFSDGCSADGVSSCAQDGNDYLAFLKFAYINIPLWGGGKLFARFGQQETPISHAQNGFSLQDTWGHRYLDFDGRQAFHEFGFTSAAERGLSINFRQDYFGLTGMLTNGEGFRRVNGQILRNRTLSDMANGAGDSYGLDFFGSASVRPTGKQKEFEFTLTAPLRLRNVTGIAREETEFLSADISNPATPRATWLRGNKRSRQDVFYGAEADAVIRRGDLEVTVGLGQGWRIDKRSDASRLTDGQIAAGIDPADLRSIRNAYADEEDAYGGGRFAFLHFKYLWLGGFFRYTEGTLGNSLDGTIGVATRKSWQAQALNLDAADGVIGNLAYGSLRNLDLGRARFQKLLFGLTWHANDRVRISIGLSRLTGTGVDGYALRTNAFERISGQGAGAVVAQNLAQQLNNSAALKGVLGLGSGDTLQINDFVGTRVVDQQIFIRSQYLY